MVMRTRTLALLAAALILVPAASAAAANKAPLIVGGTAAASGAWPSIAFLQGRYSDGSGHAHEFDCTGSVVAPQWIVTAGHCAFGNPGQSPDSMNATLGVTDYTDPNAQVIAVDQFVPDPSYDPGHLVDDVALLHLQQATSVPAIPIATSATASAGGYVSDANVPNAAGWGAVNEAGTQFTTDLQQAYLQIQSAQDCSALVSGFDAGTQTCAGTPGSTTACFGDSGGPLVMFDASTHQPVLWGVTSYRPEPGGDTAQCSVAVPTVYTSLPAFAGFLNSTIATGNQAAGAAPAPAASPDAGNANAGDPLPAAPAGASPRCRRTRTALTASRKTEHTLLRRLHLARRQRTSAATRERASRRYHAGQARVVRDAAAVRRACAPSA
jgi:secreted trypsin-like serine protease